MIEQTLYEILMMLYIVWGIGSFIALFFIPAPYGKFTRTGFGPMLRGDFVFMIQELPSFWVFLLNAYLNFKQDIACFILSGMFLLHYFYRSMIYPFRMDSNKKSTLIVGFCAFFFTTGNGYIQSRGIYIDEIYPTDFIC